MSSKISILETLKNLDIKDIYDVGVNHCTPELIAAFPKSKHYLFELNPIFTSSIRKNYASIDHELFLVGLSDTDSTLFLIAKSIMKDGVVTHNQLSNKREQIDGMSIIECKECNVKRLDSMKIDVREGSVLKVDIDGQDINVIKGAGELITRFSVIIIESTTRKMAETINEICSRGFIFFDIADMIHYGPALYQADLVFVNKKFITNKLKPDIKNFDKSLWRPASKT